MKKLFYLFLAVSFFFLPQITYADSFTEKENNADRMYASGDDLAFWKSFESLLLSEQNDWRSSLYFATLASFSDIVGAGNVSKTFTALLNGLNSMPASPERNAKRLRLLLEYEKLKLRYTMSASATENFTPINTWQATGPYKLYGKADITYNFSPELSSDVSGAEPSRLVRVNSVTGFADLSDAFRSGDGITYASVSFAAERPILLHVLSVTDYVCFINGKAILQNHGEAKQDHRIIRISSSGNITLMLKIAKKPNWRFKVFATDTDYAPITLTCETGQRHKADITASEEELYPLKHIKAMPTNTVAAKAEKHYRMALFYDDQDSLLAVEEYRVAAELDKSISNRYSHAATLAWLPYNEESAWQKIEARRIINLIHNEDPSFVPARLAIIDTLIRERNADEVLRKGAALLREHPYKFSAYLKYLDFLNSMNYEKEFLELHKVFEKNFPDSVYPKLAFIYYQKTRNPSVFAAKSLDILKVSRNEDIFYSLFEYYVSTGNFTAASQLVESNKWASDADMMKADISIGSGDYNGAKRLMFRAIAGNPSPLAYYKAGLAEYLNGGDPVMYWRSALKLDSSLFYLQEYCDYLQNGKHDVPLRDDNYLVKDMKTIFEGISPYRQPSRVISRSRIFLLEKNVNRVFCEDVIHLNSEKGVDEWGEYKVPYNGKLNSVVFRVYYDDGSFSDTYSVNEVEGSYYVNLMGLEKNSILVMQYLVENAVSTVGGTSFYSMGTDFLQSYEEPLDSFKVSIIADASMALSITGSQKWVVSTSNIEGKKLYSFSGDKLPVLYYENFSGSNENILPWYGFSTIKSEDDLAIWYSSLIPIRKSQEVDEYASKLKGEDIDATLKNVYNYISRDIILTSSMLYYPDTPRTVLYRKSGSVEDKVIAARDILASLGIFSYPALVRSKTRPTSERAVSPNYFDSILLYVPLADGGGSWWDFSDRNIALNTVSPWLSGQAAWIPMEGFWEKKNVVKDAHLGRSDNYSITIDENGNGLCKIEAGFSGIYSIYRRYFNDKRYLEEGVNAFCGSLFPSFSLNKYSVENVDNFNETLKVYAEGTVLSVADAGLRRLVFEPVKNKSIIHQYIAYPSRKHNLFLPPIFEQEKYTYTLPDSFIDSELNEERSVSGSFGTANFSYTKKKGDKKLTVIKNIAVSKTMISSDEYSEFLNFCMKVREAETFNVILHANK